MVTPSFPVTRRRFVHSAVVGGSAVAVGTAAAQPGDEPLMRFIQINDLHIQAPPQRPATPG